MLVHEIWALVDSWLPSIGVCERDACDFRHLFEIPVEFWWQKINDAPCVQQTPSGYDGILLGDVVFQVSAFTCSGSSTLACLHAYMHACWPHNLSVFG